MNVGMRVRKMLKEGMKLTSYVITVKKGMRNDNRRKEKYLPNTVKEGMNTEYLPRTVKEGMKDE